MYLYHSNCLYALVYPMSKSKQGLLNKFSFNEKIYRKIQIINLLRFLIFTFLQGLLSYQFLDLKGWIRVQEEIFLAQGNG